MARFLPPAMLAASTFFVWSLLAANAEYQRGRAVKNLLSAIAFEFDLTLSQVIYEMQEEGRNPGDDLEAKAEFIRDLYIHMIQDVERCSRSKKFKGQVLIKP